MNIYISKFCVLFLLTICRLVAGLCPLFISRKFKRKCGLERVSKSWVETAVEYSMDFSGGLLLATCFIHMIPEVREQLVSALQQSYQFPYAELLVCIGFFVVFVIEESVKQLAKHKTTSHQLLSKAGTLIPTKGCESRAAIDDDATMSARACGETAHMSIDAGIENGSGGCGGGAVTNGITGLSGGAIGSGDSGVGGAGVDASSNANTSTKYMLEMSSLMMKEELGLGECNNNANKSHQTHALKNILLVSALSFHSVMEGLAIGLALGVSEVWYLFFAVTVHECTILVCVGIELVTSCSSVMVVVIYMAIFALVSPAGVLLGTLLTLSWTKPDSSPIQSIVVSSLQGLAAGTILYVTFFEVLSNQKHHHHHHHRSKTQQSKSAIPQLLFILLGFLFMVVLELIGDHENKHAECHSHEH